MHYQHTRTGEESEAWVDLPPRWDQAEEVEVHVPHLPEKALQGGRMPECYPVLSFRLVMLSSPPPHLPGHDKGQVLREESAESRSHSSPVIRASCPDNDGNDDDDVVIGLAVGLGVVGMDQPR